MPSTLSCRPCCDAETQTVEVPGPEGSNGNDGSDGVNAYGIVTVDFDVPAIGDTVTVTLDNGIWMVVGQKVVFDGPATFEVVTVNSATSVTLRFMGYADDVAPGTTISAGAGVSPSGTQPALSSLSVYASGTPPALTATPGLLDFGTTDPTLVITSPGTWLLFCNIRLDYAAATFASSRTIALKVRRTNNTAADVTNATAGGETGVITTTTKTENYPIIVSYTTANSDDLLELWGSVSVAPSAGDLTAAGAFIMALKIS